MLPRTLLALPASVLVFIFSGSAAGQTTFSTAISPASSTSTSGIAQPTSHSEPASTAAATGVSHLPSPPPLLSTSTLSSVSPSPTTSSIVESPTTDGDNAYDPSASENQHSNLVNLYFFFLLLAGILIGAVVCLIYRRKRLRAQARRSSRRDALERDLTMPSREEAGARGGGTFFGPIDGDRWRDRRRWLVGSFTAPARPQGPNRDFLEGLDGAGEAPPPYKPRSEPGDQHGAATGEHKPPDYIEAERGNAGTDGSAAEGSGGGSGGNTRRPSAET